MIDSATPAPAWARPAAPDRYPLNRPVAPPLCRSRVYRPASTVRGHAGTRAADLAALVRGGGSGPRPTKDRARRPDEARVRRVLIAVLAAAVLGLAGWGLP